MKLRQKLKIWQSLNTENNSKFSKGDRVVIKLYSNKRIEGTVTKIFWTKPKNGDIPLYKYRVEFTRGPQDEVLRYDFFDRDLEHLDVGKFRNWKLSQVLNSTSKFGLGDEVIIVDDGYPNTFGKVVDIDFDWSEPIYKVKLYKEMFIKYELGCLRFHESSLKFVNSDDERDWKIKEVLK